MLEILKEVGIAGFLDILVMSLLVYSILVWFKRTKAVFVVIGMATLGVAYLFARQLGLELTVTLLQGFFAVFVIAVVVIFQEEIKHFFEQIASWSRIRNLRGRKLVGVPSKEIDILVNTLASLAKDHIGALLVIRGKDPIVRHLDGGTDLNGELSEPLLKSIFDPHSVGHDGAVIIRGDQITQFGCHLPLSKNTNKTGRSGTRHAAALGMAEVTDALCLVVSEERGTISAARNGEMQLIADTGKLATLLERFYEEIIPPQEAAPWKGFFKKNYKEKVIAVAVTIFLWFFFVHESKLDYRTYRVPVEYTAPPKSLVVEDIEPPDVEITFSGPRRAFYFVSEKSINVSLKLFFARPGTFKKSITLSNLTIPEGLAFEHAEPGEVTVTLGVQHTPR